jgi:two-component system nitrate/nitrite sensor histidine kinase NarX
LNDKGTILIVDDNPHTLNMLFKMLQRVGYEVMVAQDGPSTLERIESFKPDLILLDVMMPGMDGFEVAAHLKAREASWDIPIIFLTALNETANIVKGFEVGGVDYLTKPISIEEALARINTHLSLHKLQNRLRTRTQELVSRLELSRSLVSTLDLNHLANLILDQLKIVVDYSGCALTLLTEGKLRVLAYRGPTPQEVILEEYFSGEILRPSPARGSQETELFVSQKPLIVADLPTDERLLYLLRQNFGKRVTTLFSYTRAWMAVPLVVKGQIIGALFLSHEQPDRYTSWQAQLVSDFADQAAFAIENARLYQQARQAATHEERNRLARTLHDSVTQSLFSASLIAEVLPQVWQRDPTEGQQGLAELRRLTQGALADMRTLLLELRPTALLKTPLDELLRQLAQTVTSQTQVNVKLNLTPAPNLPAEVHVTFYRVAQEAFNNIAKHAQAKNITVTLQTRPTGYLYLEIRDDGRGFNSPQIIPGKLGLEIMHERAKQIEASLTLASQPGRGTRVALVWPEG